MSYAHATSYPYDENVYYYPEKSSLKVVGTLDVPGLSYEYETLVAWQDMSTKRLFYARDSGCSCPTPFEQYYFKNASDTNLTEIKPGDSFTSFEREVENFGAGEYHHIDKQLKDDLITKVKELMKE